MPVISGGSNGVVFWLLFGALSPQTGSRSHLSSVSQPSRTWPKTVCILFKCGCCSYKIKNCDLLVFGPRFAIESLPRRSCLLFGWNSSGNVTSSPQIEDFFPVTWCVSPPCIMNPRMFRWNIVPLYFPAAASARKLKAVRGHVSQKISHFKSPAVVWIVTDILFVCLVLVLATEYRDCGQ